MLGLLGCVDDRYELYDKYKLRKPIGDISLDGLGQDWTLRRFILHLNNILDLNILLYLENDGLAGNHSCDMMATDESFIGDVSISFIELVD